jgi:hypothetical protein
LSFAHGHHIASNFEGSAGHTAKAAPNPSAVSSFIRGVPDNLCTLSAGQALCFRNIWSKSIVTSGSHSIRAGMLAQFLNKSELRARRESVLQLDQAHAAFHAVVA